MLDYVPVTLVFSVIVILGTASLWMTTQQELAPQEDQGFIFAFGPPSPTASVTQYGKFSAAVYNELKDNPNIDFLFQLEFTRAAVQISCSEALECEAGKFGSGAEHSAATDHEIPRLQ